MAKVRVRPSVRPYVYPNGPSAVERPFAGPSRNTGPPRLSAAAVRGMPSLQVEGNADAALLCTLLTKLNLDH